MSGKFDMTNNDRYRLALRQGETLNREIAISSECGEVFDLEGYSARMQVRATAASDPLFSVTTEDGDSVDCTFTDAGDIITSSAHYLTAGCPLVFTTVNTTTGITVGQVYYVINPTTNTFQISATYGGTKVNFHNDGTGIYHTIGRGISIDADAGTLDIIIGANCTAHYTAGIYLYDLLLIAADGTVTTLISGRFEVTDRITQQPVITL